MTTYNMHIAEGAEWGGSEGRPVLSLDGEWIADLPLPEESRWNFEAVEQAAAEALGKPVESVTATPVGGNVVGDASSRNTATTSDEWEVEAL